jgi:GT2 family glycosyltransferase
MSFSIENSIDASIQICFVVVFGVNKQITGIDKHMNMLVKKREVIPVVAGAANMIPARIVEIELGQPLPILSALDEKTGQSYRRAICLVRLHSQPLGLVELQLEKSRVRADEYAPYIWHSFGAEINEHLQQDSLLPVSGLDASGLSSPGIPVCLEERERFLTNAPFVSVIVPTRDRPERIQACLRSLMALHYPKYEIIVVDNAPSTSVTADFIQQTYHDEPRVHYVREDHPGASSARNCGMMAAMGEILAFADDDAVIDPYWLIELVRAFRTADDVACVTGLVLPLELDTPAQFWLEEWGGFCKGFTRRVFDMAENHPKTPLHPYTAGRFGTGASMAFKAAFLRRVGGFDLALGPASPAQGGEDLAAFFQVVTRGYKLVYEPAAVAYHPHYRDYIVLRKQIYRNGIGLTAYLTKILLDNPRLLFGLIPKLPYGLVFTLSARLAKNSQKSAQYPKELTMLELKGMLFGPFAYVLSRWTVRKAKITTSTEVRSTLALEKEI